MFALCNASVKMCKHDLANMEAQQALEEKSSMAVGTESING
ncbi:MAG: hypothetical protein ACOX2Q_08560 [Dehalobacterium sp.]